MYTAICIPKYSINQMRLKLTLLGRSVVSIVYRDRILPQTRSPLERQTNRWHFVSKKANRNRIQEPTKTGEIEWFRFCKSGLWTPLKISASAPICGSKQTAWKSFDIPWHSISQSLKISKQTKLSNCFSNRLQIASSRASSRFRQTNSYRKSTTHISAAPIKETTRLILTTNETVYDLTELLSKQSNRLTEASRFRDNTRAKRDEVHFMNRNLNRIVDKLSEVMKSNVWILNRHFNGEPKIEDFQLEEQELGDVQDGGESITLLCKSVIISCFSELICEAEYLSVDPYQRTYMLRYPEGTPVIGTQVAKYVIS